MKKTKTDLLYITVTLGETEEGPYVYSRFDIDVPLMKAYGGDEATYLAEESKPHFDAMLMMLKKREKND